MLLSVVWILSAVLCHLVSGQTGVCMSERARGCNTDNDCCEGTCTSFPWGKQCRLNPIYKSPTTQPTEVPTTAIPTANPSEDPTTDPTADPTLDPTADPTVAEPSADPTTAEPSVDPTTAVPTTAAPSLDWVEVSPGYFATKGNQIINEMNEPVRFAGINWFGFETETKMLHGIHLRSYRSILKDMKDLGFNMLRLPVSHNMIHSVVTQHNIHPGFNADLKDLTPLEVLDVIVAYCGYIDFRILIDYHSFEDDGFIDEDLWYIPGEPEHSEEVWINDWLLLAERYKNNPTVVAFDLRNEPKRTATWGKGVPETDWNEAAERCGNAILDVNPDVLIFVEGVQSYNGTDDFMDLYNSTDFWWGGNLYGVNATPVQLNKPNRLVYSMHVYNMAVLWMPWYSDPNYPENLHMVWDRFFGFIFKQNIAPLFLGEFGGTLIWEIMRQHWVKLAQYIDADFDGDGTPDLPPGQKGMGWSFWCINPNSGDTGGIYKDDWKTLDEDKLSYLYGSMDPLSLVRPWIDENGLPVPSEAPTVRTLPEGVPCMCMYAPGCFENTDCCPGSHCVYHNDAYSLCEAIPNQECIMENGCTGAGSGNCCDPSATCTSWGACVRDECTNTIPSPLTYFSWEL